MISTPRGNAHAPQRGRAGRRLAVAALAAATVSVASPMIGRAAAVPSCGGNQKVETAPFTCANDRTIDGTTFSVVLDVSSSDVVTVTYTLDAPRSVDTPIRIRSHTGISSPPNVFEASGTIPAGATTATLTTTLNCGQIDIKAVFTGNGDARGRVVGPFVTNTNNCASSTSTTTPTTTPSTSTAPTTTPTSGQTGSSVEAITVTSVPSHAGSLPVTGSGLALALFGGAFVVGGLAIVTIGRARHSANDTL